MEYLESQIEKRNLEKSVRLIGSVSDIRPYLVHADLFLLPSYGEGLPNSYLEAMAMGVPTLVSTDPPYDDIASPEYSFRINRNDREMVIAKIVACLQNADIRAGMGKTARKVALNRYAWPVIASRYLGLFHQLLIE